MRIHSDVFTRDDFQRALRDAGLVAHDVILDVCEPHGSRRRLRGFEIQLAAVREYNGKSKRRRRNSGIYGARGEEEVWAATYAEHGLWMAQLYEKDPDAIVGPYKDRDDFDDKTRNEFRIEGS